jgi:hypothetical protein
MNLGLGLSILESSELDLGFKNLTNLSLRLNVLGD